MKRDQTLNDDEVSHAQFRALANSIPNLAWMAHPDGWIFWYNRRWYEYTGTTPEEMAGWGWQSVHDPEVLPEMLDRWTAALANGVFFEMIFPLKGADGVFRPFLTRVDPLREDGKIVGWFGTNTEVTEQERTRDRLQLVINELNHRVKNTLATIQSLARNSFGTLDKDLLPKFEKRLLSLAALHEVLTREGWTRAPVEEIVRNAIELGGPENVSIEGPAVSVEPRIAAALAMTLYELLTNAIKYGALSQPGGKIAVNWTLDESGHRSPALTVNWRESGGPPVRSPERKGFGMRLIERSLSTDKGASVVVDFAPEGLAVKMVIPAGVDVIT